MLARNNRRDAIEDKEVCMTFNLQWIDVWCFTCRKKTHKEVKTLDGKITITCESCGKSEVSLASEETATPKVQIKTA